MTLMETLLATVILLVSIVALGTQSAVGIRAADKVRLETLSSILCQSVLDEHLARRNIVNELQPQTVPGYPDWVFTTTVHELTNPEDRLQTGENKNLVAFSATTWRPGRDANDSFKSLTQVVRKDVPRSIRVSSGRGSNE